MDDFEPPAAMPLDPAPAPDLVELAPEEPPRRRTGLLVGVAFVVVIAVAALVAVVSRGDDGSVSLAAAADQTSAADSMRFEMTMSFDGLGAPGTDGIVLMEGERSGDRASFRMDTGALGQSGDAGAGQRMEMYRDGDFLYIYAPLFSTLDTSLLGDKLVPLAELGERWGRVDLREAGEGAGGNIASTMLGGQAMDLSAALDVLRAHGSLTEETGHGEVRGVAVTEYAGDITFGELLEAQGASIDMFSGLFAGSSSGIDMDAVFDALRDVPMGLTASVDDDGFVRRLAFTYDDRFFAAVADQLGEDPGEMPDFEMESAIEIFDIDDPSITVSPPDIGDDFVDLTEWAKELAS